MPKTAKNLWPRVVEWENLMDAAKAASQGRRCYRAVLEFNFRLWENLTRLRELLVQGLWRPGPYRELWVREPKLRLVHAPEFTDRVVHHALVQVAGPFFEKRFMDCSFACRRGTGTHAASEHMSRMLRQARDRWDSVYVLKADIAKYFFSIDHSILMDILARTIGDRRMLEAFRLLVESGPAPLGSAGLPLGALTSQLFANAYLDVLDHYVKDRLGVKLYVRYMDDFIILDGCKAALWELLAEIRDFLAVRLKLSLNRKTKVFPASQGVDFAGYRHWASHTLPRKRNVRRAAKRFKGLSRAYARGDVPLDRVRSCMASFVGYMVHCKGWRSAGSALSGLVLIGRGKDRER